jgi:hypothetical protein
MIIQSLRSLALLAFFLGASNSSFAEEKPSPDNHLIEQADQLFETLQLAGQSTQKLYVLAKGMNDQVGHMLYDFKGSSDWERLRAAQDRVASVDRVANYLDRAHFSADKFLTALNVYKLFRSQPDKQRIAPYLARIRDGQVKAMEGMLTSLEQSMLPGVPISAVDMVRAAIGHYRDVQNLMLTIQF